MKPLKHKIPSFLVRWCSLDVQLWNEVVTLQLVLGCFCFPYLLWIVVLVFWYRLVECLGGDVRWSFPGGFCPYAEGIKKGKVVALHAMTEHGIQDVQQLQSFVTSALYCRWRCYKLHTPAALTLEKERPQPLGGWFCGRRTGQDALMTTTSYTCRDRMIPRQFSQWPRQQTHDAILAPRTWY